jgi:hypothetical protein
MLYKVSVIRRIKNASTATCTLPIYMGFLMQNRTLLAHTTCVTYKFRLIVKLFLEREDNASRPDNKQLNY